jgi:type II secretory pathway component PulF
MPYYRWQGVTLTGATKRGKLFARSTDHLDELLFKRNIALLKYKQLRNWGIAPITLKHHIHLFQQLATLIDAGIAVPHAVQIVANQVEHHQLQERMHQVAQLVHAGTSLSAALFQTGAVQSSIILQLIRAGEESGNLSQALDAICTHIRATQDFQRRLRSALFLPAITLGFFLVILIIIFTVIMPRFIDIFGTMNAQIPPLTQKLLAVSFFMRSASMGLFISVVALVILVCWRITRKGAGRRAIDWSLLHIPFVGTLIQNRFLSYSMRAIAVLLEGGLPLDTAIQIVRESVSNHILQQYLVEFEAVIRSGGSLSSAMTLYADSLFSQDSIAMVEVGEESGRLPALLLRVADAYHYRVMQQISFLTMLVQPAVMILLGLLVALLIFAVYGPIFSMSRMF